jgi:hypothetical protein
MIAIDTVRIKVDRATAKGGPQFSADMWKGAATAFQVGLFRGGVAESIEGVSSLTWRVKNARMGSVTLMSKTIAGNDLTECTSGEWQAGTGQHATFEFSAAECNLPMGGKNAAFHVTITALLLSGATVTCGVGELRVWDANAEVAGDPPENPEALLTIDIGDARYLLISSVSNDRVTLPNGKFFYLNTEEESEIGRAHV